MICKKCGKQIKDDAKWCLYCGTEQKAENNVSSQNAELKPESEVVVSQPQTVVITQKPETKKKSKFDFSRVKKHKKKLITGGVVCGLAIIAVFLAFFIPYYNNTLVPKGHYDHGVKVLNDIQAKEKSGGYKKSTDTYFNLSEDFVPMINEAYSEFNQAGDYTDAPLYACALSMIKILYVDKKDPYTEWDSFLGKYQNLVDESKEDGKYLTEAGKLYGFAMGGMQYYAAYDYYQDKNKDKAKKYLGYSFNWYDALPDDYSFAGMTKKEKVDKCYALARTFDDLGWVDK